MTRLRAILDVALILGLCAFGLLVWLPLSMFGALRQGTKRMRDARGHWSGHP